MGKVVRKEAVKTFPFKVNLTDEQLSVIHHLESMLKADKTLHYDRDKHLGEAIVKEARSAIKDIEKLQQPTPPPIPSDSLFSR